MPDLKYWYYSKESTQLIKLGFSSINDWSVTLVSFPYTYSLNGESYKFETERDLVFFCDEHNREVKKKYNETYKIKPPYLLRTFFDFAATNVACIFIYKGNGLLFKDMQTISELNRAVWNRRDDMPIYDFFEKCNDKLFSVDFLLKFHRFALVNAVFTPEITLDGKVDFKVRVKNKVYYAKVRGGYSTSRTYFLHFCNISNDIVFEYYNIPSETIHSLFTIVDDGLWPYSDEKTLYAIIDFINESRYAGLSQKISIKDNVITCKFGMFTIEQNKNGKWYIKGDIEKICQLFGASTCAELRRFVDRTLGEKIRHGVFPECDSRDEIFKLLDKVKNV